MKDAFSRLSVGRALMIGIALAGAYYFFIFDSGTNQNNNITSAKTQIADLTKQLGEAQAKLDRAATYKKTAAETGLTINKLLAIIPEKFGIPDLMKLVSNEAKVAGASLLGITPSQPEVSKFAKEFEEFTVHIDLNGSFLQHMTFLSNLTKINQILIVRKFDLSITKEAKGDDAAMVHMVADIVAYRYRGSAVNTTGKPGDKPAGGK